MFLNEAILCSGPMGQAPVTPSSRNMSCHWMVLQLFAFAEANAALAYTKSAVLIAD